MRLKNYLILEEGRSQVITKEEALAMLNSNEYKPSLKGTPMYRGLPSYKGDFLIISPSKFMRKSRNTFNYYTLLMDNLPQWREYPKRSKSIICTTSIDTAHRYSDKECSLYVVIPKVGSKIGVCPYSDIWMSFYEFDTLVAFNHVINHLLSLTDIRFIDDINDIWSLFTYYDNMISNLHHSYADLDPNEKKKYDGESDFIYNTIKKSLLSNKEIEDGTCEYETLSKLCKHYSKGGKTLDFFAELLDPDENGFMLKKAGHKLPVDNEVWTDGTSILIAKKMFDNLTKLW